MSWYAVEYTINPSSPLLVKSGRKVTTLFRGKEAALNEVTRLRLRGITATIRKVNKHPCRNWKPQM